MENEKAIKALLKELTGLETAILRERLLKIAEITLKSIEKNPESFRNPIIDERIYKTTCNKIIDKLKFE